ncbi:MAG: DegT/DnrJ/EryC1/StrS family aminotransferase, partial [Nitrosopumilus sp.]
MHRIKKLMYMFRRIPKDSYFGFIQGHNYLDDVAVERIQKIVGKSSLETIEKFETEFAAQIGRSQAVSFAAGRMGFYALMKILGIGKCDEVILLGHTCSVMPNAVWRTDAKPVFADIDPNTFGSSAKEIEKVITFKTKMIVAQHSFGIPCKIEPIVDLARQKGIFLLEDCAITLGSKINGIQVGNFG